jgi:ketosteroid isomerase-like protein
VEKLYALSGAGDWAAVAEYMSDDLVIVEADSLPYGGAYTGRNALRDLFEKVMAYWEDPSVEMHGITASQDRGVSILTLNVTSRQTGRRLALDIAETFRFRDSKLIEIKPYYFDTHLIVEDARG